MGKTISFFAMIGLLFFVASVAHADLFMSVSGKVVAADNDAGLGGVRVLLMSPQKGKITETMSNAQGVFILRDVPKGDYGIWALSEDPFVVSAPSTVPVTVPDGKNVVGIGIKLQRGGAVKGKVVTSTGKIVPNATILGSNTSATTDATGSFLLQGATPGSLTLAAMASSIAPKGFTTNCEVGKVVDVGNVVLPVGAASAIRGTIVDTLGNPLSGVIVTATNANAPGAYAKSSTTGSFVITGLSSDKFKLTVVKLGYEPFSMTEVPVPSSNLSLRLTPSQVPVASMTQCNTNVYKSDVERMYQDNIIPASFLDSFSNYEGPPGDGTCPKGCWIGTSIDFTLGARIPGEGISFGGQHSIGGLACLSRHVEFGFSQTCSYSGFNAGGVSIGFSGIVARKAYDAWNNILSQDPNTNTNTQGIYFGPSYGIHSGGIAIDWNSTGARFVSISYALGPTFPSMEWFLPDYSSPGKYNLSASGMGRRCSSSVLTTTTAEDLDLGI